MSERSDQNQYQGWLEVFGKDEADRRLADRQTRSTTLISWGQVCGTLVGVGLVMGLVMALGFFLISVVHKRQLQGENEHQAWRKLVIAKGFIPLEDVHSGTMLAPGVMVNQIRQETYRNGEFGLIGTLTKPSQSDSSVGQISAVGENGEYLNSLSLNWTCIDSTEEGATFDFSYKDEAYGINYRE
jgi:hypothetical protein